MRISAIRLILAVLAVVFIASTALAGRVLRSSKGQKVYVPVYSHIYQGIKGKPYNLSAMLSIRNVDPQKAITLYTIKYFDDDGRLVKSYVSERIIIPPLGTREVYIPESDTSGGSGANFTVRWKSEEPVAVPVIQAVMIGTASAQGISFVCDGVVIEEE